MIFSIEYLLKNKSTKYVAVYLFTGVITIEAIQLFTNRGIFYICDIILNMLGRIIGYYFTKNIMCKFQFSE
ncbi:MULTISPECIES: VanZ family protein [Clostridium]|uniref:VanZ family protein n=1 Tax=Clostridium TaxID=1485 RepID=UPI000DD01294|nr:VanZ family protein [Clostridium sp.]MBS5886805.1 VanZ family protein [Clostridium sp.]